MKNSIKILGLILLIIVTSSFKNNNHSKNFDYGHVKKGVYFNDFFGFNIELPEDWVVQSKEQTENLANSGRKLVIGDNKNLKAIIEASEINTANLLIAFQYELGSPVDYNPSIMIIAENIKNAPGIKNGSDYLYQAKRLIQQTQLKYEYLSEKFDLEKINEVEFYKMNTRVNYLDLDIKQEYYSTVLNGFSLNFIISYISDDQKEVLISSINSLTFNN